jgi:phage-related minor tail protein
LRLVTATETPNGRLEARTKRSIQAVPKRVAIIRMSGTVSRGIGMVAPAVGGLLYGVDPHAPFAVGAVVTAAGFAISLTLPR